MMQPSQPRILTGLRANNALTIGNYLGAIQPMAELAKKNKDTHDFFMFVPDLHSFTTPINHKDLFASAINNVRFYMAAGAINNDTTVYRQSFVPAHSELTWILDCFTGMGEMGRMTQYKDKSTKLTAAPLKSDDNQAMREELDAAMDRISVGLFNYPVLMAADILLYHATYVPLGDDQKQHLEFTRDIAERMNTRFGNLFTVPLPTAKQHEFFGRDQGLRIRDLQNPTKKMSKSDESGKGVIFLTDSPETAGKKVMAATTDSLNKIAFGYQSQPGVSNLLELLALLTNQKQENINAHYTGRISYGALKADVAKAVGEFLHTLQTAVKSASNDTVLAKLEEGEAKAREIASQTLLTVQQAVGLRQK